MRVVKSDDFSHFLTRQRCYLLSKFGYNDSMEPFKNKINDDTVKQISKNIKRHYLEFNETLYCKNINSELSDLELKDRIKFLSKKLHAFLPKDFKLAAKILKKAVGPSSTLSGFNVWPLTEYISTYGEDELDLSLEVLKEMTKVFTSEFAVRVFFIKNPKRTLGIFKEWARDENEHVRRLVSEGSRPLLPWGQKISEFVKSPQLTLDLLELVKNDESLYVRKSVANHLNDHSKNHPDLVIKTLQNWKKADPKNKNIEWIIRHASRTLVKKAHPKALALHGVSNKKIDVLSLKLKTNHIKINECLEISVTILNKSKTKSLVILDVDLHLLKANNSYNVKCFKGKKVSLNPDEKKLVLLKIPLKKVTTRTYYSGIQYLSCKVNGTSTPKKLFKLDC